MTYNEFKMCCILFCKTFEGRKYGEVVKDCYEGNFDLIIPNTPMVYNYIFRINDKMLFSLGIDGDNLMVLHIHNFNNHYFKTIKDFLNYFKIPFKDIV